MDIYCESGVIGIDSVAFLRHPCYLNAHLNKVVERLPFDWRHVNDILFVKFAHVLSVARVFAPIILTCATNVSKNQRASASPGSSVLPV